MFSQYLIAEIGSVHDGSIGNAKKLIQLAAACGANAVKFQTHISDAEMTNLAPAPSYFSDEDRKNYFDRTGFTIDKWHELKNECELWGVDFISSPFSLDAFFLLEDIGVSSYKIPSGEVSNIPLLEKIGETNKPVLLSTGMSTLAEIDEAVEILKGSSELVVMQCSSIYPCPPEMAGLNLIDVFRDRYDCAVGFSDHTIGLAIPIAAAARGASVIEKHFTFSTEMYGSDAKHSMEPAEFKILASSLADVWVANNNIVIKDQIDFSEMRIIFQKSIVASRPWTEGHVLSFSDLAFKKPGDGIAPRFYSSLIGKTLVRSLKYDEKISWDHIK